MKLAGKKVLVTGADGFIGSHLVEELIRVGCDVRAFVYYNSFGSMGWLDTLPNKIRNQIDIIVGDIRDDYVVKQAVSGRDGVFHLAALIGIPYSYQAPTSYVDTNVKGTLHVLQAAREVGVEKIIHTSTSEVYGTAQFVPITEEHPLQAQSPYAATKIAADQLAMSYFSSFGTPVAIIRPFNTYGSRQSLRAVIPTVITQISNGGTRIKLGSLHPTRDFNFIHDTVRGFMAIAESEQSIGQVINIGSNYEISIGELVQLIANIMQRDIHIETEEVRLRPKDSEVERLWADNMKAKKLTGWSPEYAGSAGLRRGLEETIAWFIKKENLKKYNIPRYHI